jgi:predicted enzyme related to lactoylglutathione lyase
MTTLNRLAPVFATADLARSLVHYERLGFTVEPYSGGDFYGFVRRDGVEIHLALVDGLDPASTTSCAYLYVDDAAALYQEWATAGAKRIHPPMPTDYGLLEGAHVDPDGNLIRFGSPLDDGA